jgi:hypothetical protein
MHAYAWKYSANAAIARGMDALGASNDHEVRNIRCLKVQLDSNDI